MNREERDPSDEDPVAFNMLVSWLDVQDGPIPYEPLRYSDEPWRSHAANAWILGDRLGADEFKKYALSQFITNCGLADLHVWELIEKQVPENSSLRRFANHWVAWNHSFSAADSEYDGLEAAKLGGTVSDETCDPREYNLNHWFSTCGDDINSTCAHHPTARITTSTTIVTVREPAAEWGYEWETQQKGSLSKPEPRSP